MPCGLGQLNPLPTSGDEKGVAAKHCRRAKRSRISDTHGDSPVAVKLTVLLYNKPVVSTCVSTKASSSSSLFNDESAPSGLFIVK